MISAPARIVASWASSAVAATRIRVRAGAGSSAARAANASSSRCVRGRRGAASAAALPPRVERDREFAQRQRVSLRVRQHALTRRERQAGKRLVEQLRGRIVGEPVKAQLRESGPRQRAVVTLAERGEQHDRVRFDAPSDEREHVGGRAVEPVRVLRHS